jgi:hypothetical protein
MKITLTRLHDVDKLLACRFTSRPATREMARRALDAIWSAHNVLEFEGGDDRYMLVYRPGVDHKKSKR